MGERLERWKARETVRRTVGWLAIFLGIGGAFGAITGLFVLAGPALVEAEEPDVGVPVALALILLGIAFLVSARGLSRGQPWARWVAVALLVASCARRLPSLVREFELDVGWGLVLFSMAIPLSVIAYLLLPSTGRFFASGGGSKAKGLPG